MDIERLRKIMEYSNSHRDEIALKVRKFYAFSDMSSDTEVINIMQIARSAFQKKGYLIFEMPLSDKEIGALCYKGDALGYIMLNSSLPRVNINFAVCHELYHVFYQENEFGSKVEFAIDKYYGEEELVANLFAGMLLMPEVSFRSMYKKFKGESENREMHILIRLMNYYQVPYMAVLIRCIELNLLNSDIYLDDLLNIDYQCIRSVFADLWLDESILDATKKDDYVRIQKLVNDLGNRYIENDYINKRTMQKVLRNMEKLYLEIKGES